MPLALLTFVFDSVLVLAFVGVQLCLGAHFMNQLNIVSVSVYLREEGQPVDIKARVHINQPRWCACWPCLLKEQ